MALINCKDCGNSISDQAKSCPKCDSPVVKESQWKKKLREAWDRKVQESQPRNSAEAAFNNILGLLVLVFLFGGCVYQIGYPWNCEQAKEALAEAESQVDDSFEKAKDPWKYGNSSEDAEIDIKIAIQNKIDSEKNLSNKCYR